MIFRLPNHSQPGTKPEHLHEEYIGVQALRRYGPIPAFRPPTIESIMPNEGKSRALPHHLHVSNGPARQKERASCISIRSALVEELTPARKRGRGHCHTSERGLGSVHSQPTCMTADHDENPTIAGLEVFWHLCFGPIQRLFRSAP